MGVEKHWKDRDDFGNVKPTPSSLCCTTNCNHMVKHMRAKGRDTSQVLSYLIITGWACTFCLSTRDRAGKLWANNVSPITVNGLIWVRKGGSGGGAPGVLHVCDTKLSGTEMKDWKFLFRTGLIGPDEAKQLWGYIKLKFGKVIEKDNFRHSHRRQWANYVTS